MEHLTRAQLEDYSTNRSGAASDRTAAERHLARCPACTDALAALAPAPAWLRSALAHAAHPSDDLLERFARDAGSVSSRVAEHVACCRRCEMDVAAVRSFIEEFETPSVAARADGTQDRRSRASTESWFTRLATAVSVAEAPIRRPAATLSFSDEPSPPAWQELAFADPDVAASWRVMGDEVEIHIRHASLSGPQLALLEALDVEGRVAWRRFLVLSSGWRGRIAAEVRAPVAAVEGTTLRLGFPAAEQLDIDAATAVLDSWQSARSTAAAVWRDWLRIQGPRIADLGVRALLEEAIH
jgi:hypothetical protein